MPNLPPEALAFAAGFPMALAHLGLGVAVLVIALVVYGLVSDGREVAEIRGGNAASALIYGLTFLALALPLGKALTGSESLLSAGLWMGAAALCQLVAMRLADFVMRGLTARIRDEADLSAAAFLGAARLALAWLVASSLQG
jgi:putative membrane protein